MKSLLIVLAICCAGASATVGPVTFSSAVANDFADRMIANLARCLVENHVDPFALPYVFTNFSFDFLGHHDGSLELTDGVVFGASTLLRRGDANVNYQLQILTLDLDLEIQSIDANFLFAMEALGFSPDGEMNAILTNLRVVVSLLLDMKKTTLYVERVEVSNDGKMDLHFSDIGILGGAVNIIVDAITAVLGDNLVESIGQQLEDFINNSIGNKPLLPELPPRLEFFRQV